MLASAGCCWVVWQFVHSGGWLRLTAPGAWSSLGWRVLAGVPIYLAGLSLVATAWCLLQNTLSESLAPYRQLFAVYATTQFAKYTPGNIGHYLGRHLWLRKQGLGHAELLVGTLGEAALLVTAALAWAAPTWTSWSRHLVWAPPLWLSLLFGWLLASSGLALVGALGQLGHRFAWMARLRAWRLAILFPCYVAFFGCMTLALAWPAYVLSAGEMPLSLLAMAAAASWAAGFLVVGAPAGIGVREAVFVLLLRNYMAPDTALLLAAAFRVISFCGDLGLLLIGLIMVRVAKGCDPVSKSADPGSATAKWGEE